MSQSDPLLTTLCSICHIQPPKYRCPRCAVRTCSLACTRRHKAWSSCSGIRDATAYVPPSKLKTPAGVDHDFNFLSGIERSVQRSEKEIVEERGLLAFEDLRPVEVRSVQWRKGKDGSRKRVLVTEVLRNRGAVAGGGNAASRPDMSRQMKKRLSAFGTTIACMPEGMTRQKQNGTTVAKSSGRMNWQVEWLLVDDDGHNSKSPESSQGVLETARQTAILGKSLDHLPLYAAFSSNYTESRVPRQADVEEEEETTDQPSLRSSRQKKRKQLPAPAVEVQDYATATWPLGDYSLQPHPAAAWKRYSGTALFTGVTQVELELQAKYSFYLVPNPLSKTEDGRILVHPVDPLAPLAEALRDTTVLEFPTFYVVPASTSLPTSSFKSTPKQPGADAKMAAKRKRQTTGSQGRGGKVLAAGRPGKKARRDLEDGEVRSDEAEQYQLGSDGEDAGNGYEVVAEESLGEDGDDDTTSSSGSDSDDEQGHGGLVQASLDKKLALLGRKR